MITLNFAHTLGLKNSSVKSDKIWRLLTDEFDNWRTFHDIANFCILRLLTFFGTNNETQIRIVSHYPHQGIKHLL